MDSSQTARLARAILGAYRDGQPILPVRQQITGVSPAYAVQRACLEQWLAEGRKPAGHKIGLTSKAIQTQLGVGEPDFGVLFADMLLPTGASVARGSVLQPRIEAEFAFVLKADLMGMAVTPEDVMAATDYVVPAIEICGSRIAGWDIRIEDTIADNASSGLVVVGATRLHPTLGELAQAPVTVRHNDAVCAEGVGEACLGNPAIAVAWLASALTRFGLGLKAGDFVMSGALAKMVPAEPGSRFVADFGILGTVAVSFD